MKANVKIVETTARVIREAELKAHASKTRPVIDMHAGEGVGLYISVSEA
jgi:hypothetical protein